MLERARAFCINLDNSDCLGSQAEGSLPESRVLAHLSLKPATSEPGPVVAFGLPGQGRNFGAAVDAAVALQVFPSRLRRMTGLAPAMRHLSNRLCSECQGRWRGFGFGPSWLCFAGRAFNLKLGNDDVFTVLICPPGHGVAGTCRPGPG